jgi:hypothetical protein
MQTSGYEVPIPADLLLVVREPGLPSHFHPHRPALPGVASRDHDHPRSPYHQYPDCDSQVSVVTTSLQRLTIHQFPSRT